MSFWCKFGAHDWEYLYKDLAKNAWLKHTNCGIRVLDGPRVHKRVCLSCEKYEDTYTPYIMSREKELNNDKQRQELAQRIMDTKNEN